MMTDRDLKGEAGTRTSGPRVRAPRSENEAKASPATIDTNLEDTELEVLNFPDPKPQEFGSLPSSQAQEAIDDPLVGTMVDGRYFVERRIGEGGMGMVYSCRHTIIDKRVAMKVLRPDMAKQTEASERFLNEARSTSAIGNAHIIDIFDYGRLLNGSPYFVMEFLEGTPLVDIAEARLPQDPARIIRIGLQLADGLGAAHRAGIVHRDLKPDNVFLVRQGTVQEFVKILDFGIAKATRGTSRLTHAGQIFGTPHYMSPEQADGARIDQRTDIYALGVIFYELIAGRLPFDAENYMAVLAQHMHRKPAPPSMIEELDLYLPEGLEALILKCLEKAPPDRFQSMDEVGEELQRILSFSESIPPGPIASESEGETIVGTTVGAVTPNSRARGRHHLGLYAAAATTAALLSGSLAWTIKKSTSYSEGNAAPQMEAKSDPAIEASAAATMRQKVRVTSSPPGARLFEGEVELGEAPFSLEVGEKPRHLEARLEGFQSTPFEVDREGTEVIVTLEKEEAEEDQSDSRASEKTSPRKTTPPRKPGSRPRTDLGGEDLPSPW